jgi:hypothetical protein
MFAVFMRLLKPSDQNATTPGGASRRTVVRFGGAATSGVTGLRSLPRRAPVNVVHAA